MKPVTTDAQQQMLPYPCDAKVEVAGKASKTMADQIMTATKEPLARRMGIVARDDTRGVDVALRVQVGLAV